MAHRALALLVVGEVPVFGTAILMDLDALVEHPLGGRFALMIRLPLDVVERCVEQRPQRLAPIGLWEDQEAGVQIYLPIERGEIGLVVRDEDRFFIDNNLVEWLVSNAQQVSVTVAGCPVATPVCLVHEGGREALVDPELHADVALPAELARAGSKAGRPRRGLPFAQSAATS